MNTNANQSTTTSRRPLQLWTSVRDELRERRQTRTERRALEQELSAYNTEAEINDLLAVIEGEDSHAADQVRAILGRNLQLAS
ncbi:MAG: hypothetical protein ABWY19_10270 [Marmoricola sp.]